MTIDKCPICGGRIVIISGPNGRFEVCEVCHRYTKLSQSRENKMKMIFWDVWLWGELIDSVPYTADCNADYVYCSLVNHDGYDYHIEVRKAK